MFLARSKISKKMVGRARKYVCLYLFEVRLAEFLELSNSVVLRGVAVYRAMTISLLPKIPDLALTVTLVGGVPWSDRPLSRVCCHPILCSDHDGGGHCGVV